MNFALRQSTDTLKVNIFLADANGQGVPLLVAADVTIKIARFASATFANMTVDKRGFVEVGYGWYTITPDATDTATNGMWRLHVEPVVAGTFLPFDAEGFVYPAKTYNALFVDGTENDTAAVIATAVWANTTGVIVSDSLPGVAPGGAGGLPTVADVAAAMETVLSTTQRSELSAVPALGSATGTILTMLTALFEAVHYKRTETAGTQTLYKSNSTTPLGTKAITDDGTTTTVAKLS